MFCVKTNSNVIQQCIHIIFNSNASAITKAPLSLVIKHDSQTINHPLQRKDKESINYNLHFMLFCSPNNVNHIESDDVCIAFLSYFNERYGLCSQEL